MPKKTKNKKRVMSKTEKTAPTKYEDYSDVIDQELSKRKNKWTLTSVNLLSWEDVEQIIRFHIFKKWHLYDAQRPIQQWISVIIANQIKNLIRNHYGNYSRPCLKCEASEGSDGCRIYEKQCESCPLYAEWKKRKEPAYNIKLPLSIENHTNEVRALQVDNDNIINQVEKIHVKMKEVLKPFEYRVYEGLFILNEDEIKLAVRLGYVTNEKGRAPGYKQIKNIKKSIIAKIKKCIKDGTIDI
jgi:hypothetical protein